MMISSSQTFDDAPLTCENIKIFARSKDLHINVIVCSVTSSTVSYH